MKPVDVIGSYISPYVRKVLVCLDIKGIEYRIDPIVPFYGNDRFSELSPVRRIPVLIDDEVVLCDSTVICEYLEERYPSPSLYPSTPALRARARWLEEFADTRIGEVVIWRFFNELVIRPNVWGAETDATVVEKARDVEIPEILDYLEGLLPAGGGHFFGDFGIADIAVASFFRNADFVRYAIDSDRWPCVADLVASAHGHPSFQKLRRFEEVLLRTPLPQHRDALAAEGASLTPTSYGTGLPRPGVLSL